MRTDYFQNMQKIYRQERLRNYRNKIIFYIGIAVFAYLGVVLSITVFKRNDSAISGQAAVAKYEGEAVKQPAIPSSTAASSSTSTQQSATPVYHRSSGATHHASATSSASPLPQHTWHSTSSGVTVYTTSSASVKNIGGGGSSGGSIGGSSGSGGSSSAFGTSTSIMIVPTLARVSSRDLTAANTIAAEAEIIDNSEAGRAAKPGIRTVDPSTNPEIPLPNPVGDAVRPLLLLTLAYGAVLLRKRKIFGAPEKR